ncbi:MAG: Monosaccharide transporter rane protein family [Actinomycetia bacterium]|nr:Monosaccharide transporter rane protein family [Actinomycetes bacterium]
MPDHAAPAHPPAAAAGATAGNGTHAAGPAPGAQATAARRGRSLPEQAGLLVVLVALIAFFWVRSPYFATENNIINVLTAIAVTGIIAVPGTMLVIAGQVDLSVGSGAALCGVIMASVAQSQPIWIGVLAALAVGIVVGLINGLLVTVVGVNSLITTLGMLSALRGLTQVRANGGTITLVNFSALGIGRPFLNIPVPVLLLLGIIVIAILVMRYTVFGRSVYATGSNPVASRLVGIRGNRAIVIAFVASGLAFALSGLVLDSQLSAASPEAATGLELTVITAIVLGGASLSGGRGTIQGTLVGLLIIGVLNDGLTLLNVNSFYQEVASGVLLIIAVSFDQLRRRLAGWTLKRPARQQAVGPARRWRAS